MISSIREQGNIEVENLIWQQAKAMHKDEIVEAYYMGDRYSCACYDHTTEEDGEQYYNETFGGDNE